MVVHPIGAETELASGLGDAGSKSVIGVVKTGRAILGYEGPMYVVDVLVVLAVGEGEVEDHDGSAVHDEAHLAPEAWYSLLESAWVSSLRVRETSFTSFGVGTVGGAALDIASTWVRA